MSNLPRGKNEAYWEGYNESAKRRAVKDACRAALDAHPFLPDLANEVAAHLARDHGRKQRIVQRSPQFFAAMDEGELRTASSRELALRELKELGITVGEDDDPEKMLDMHHAGRAYARDSDLHIPGNRLAGGNTLPGAGGTPLVGSASDSREGLPSFLDKYLES